MMMRCCWIFVLAGTLAAAADEAQLALTLRAQTDFDRVVLAIPRLQDTAACAQSQAALLPVTVAEEAARVHFRKGYCVLAQALITREADTFEAAAREFDQAAAAWPVWTKDKKQPPLAVSSGIKVLATLARLEEQPDEAKLAAFDGQLAAAAAVPACGEVVMPVRLCQDLLAVAGRWRGWIAVQQKRYEDAARIFVASPASAGWAAWVRGRLAFDRAEYTNAVSAWTTAVEDWSLAEKRVAGIPAGLEPPPAMAQVLADLGGAKLLAGDARGGIASMDGSLKRVPENAWLLFVRGRAKETAGMADGALADFNRASRTAFAEAGDNAAGEGHLYRGIWLLRRQDVAGAEEEFASALNAGVSDKLRVETEAWRMLAAVNGGGCGASRAKLTGMLAEVSPFFPREEARTAVAGCRAEALAATAMSRE